MRRIWNARHIYTGGIALAALIATPMGAAQEAMPEFDDSLCAGGTVIILDEAPQCAQEDSLELLIADIETSEITASPIAAGNEGDREALRHLPDVSTENIAAGHKRYDGFKTRHTALSGVDMDMKTRLNYDLLGFVINQRLRLAPFDEARIPFTNDSGFFNMLVYVSRQTNFETPEDYEAYAARLTELPRYFRQHKANMQRGIDTNMTASAEIIPGIIGMVETLGSGDPKDHPYYAPFKTFPDSISAEEQTRLAALGEAAMNMAVLPAYKNLESFLKDEYLPKARKTVGIGTTPEGREYYEKLVRHFTTLDLTPDEVHEIGVSERDRIRAAMEEIIKEVKFEGSFADFLKFLRTDPQFYATSEEQLLKEAAWLAKQVDGQMPAFFGTLPRLSYGVIPVPASIAKTYTTGRYWGGNPKQGRAGNYVVNTSLLKQRPLYNLPALTLHEGVPGHHHQISLAQELEDVPKFRQSLYPNAFGEGWGLYAEKLGEEMGLYKTPYERFGRLTYEMWRACRLVVDTGIHIKGWTREQAVNYMSSN
ncbi:MAG: DUF885 domain-containing protein, partial [Maricaulaceae bacterium]